MRILVNAVVLTNILTGIGRTVKSLYTELEKYSDLDIWYFDGHNISKKMPSPPEKNSRWDKLVSIAWKMPPHLIFLIRKYRHKKQQKLFYEFSKDFDVYHEPGFFPFKTPESVKTVFTVHDLSLSSHPEWHPEERVKFFNHYAGEAFKYADFIVTPSEFSKLEVLKYFEFDNRKIRSVYWGYDREVFYPRSKDEITKVCDKYKIKGDYLLCVGTNDPRKNLKGVFEAYKNLDSEISLVIAGWSGWDKTNGVDSQNKIIFTGHLSDEELTALYSGAAALVYPSFYEGFGLPALEAMACGTPVITSDCSSLPEVGGDAVQYCNPNDIKSIQRAIEKVIKDPSLQEDLRKKGLARAKEFSWEKSAEEYLEVFEIVGFG